MIRLVLCLSFCLGLMAPIAVWAQNAVVVAEPPIGTLVDIEGAGNLVMRAAEQGKSYAAHTKDTVFRNDILQTGPNGGRLVVLLIDDSRFTLGENTRFKIDEYAYDDKDNAANGARYNILQGAFLYTSGLMTKKDNPDVKIATPYGSIGIRGTSLWGGNLGAQYGVYVDDGEVSLETKRGHIRVIAGNATSINSIDSVPERPKPLPPEILAAAKQTVELKDIDKIKERITEAGKNHPAMITAHKDYLRTSRLKQVDTGGSVRRQNRGVLKIEQDRQDERKKLWDQDNPPIADPMLDKQGGGTNPNTGIDAVPAPATPAAPALPEPVAPTKSNNPL